MANHSATLVDEECLNTNLLPHHCAILNCQAYVRSCIFLTSFLSDCDRILFNGFFTEAVYVIT